MISKQSKVYDFIVVGAGPAGSVIASELARTPQKPSVLLVEAGHAHNDLSLRNSGRRILDHVQQDTTWGYQSVPNPHLGDRVLPLVRGKGHGGGSLVNYGAWTEGSKQDWDRMARLVGDDAWKWDNVKKRFNALTTHHCAYPDVRPEYQRYIGQTKGNYGTSGPLHLGYSEEMEKELLELVDSLVESGIPFRPAANDGILNGLVLHPETFWRGVRSIAADLWHDGPANLEIVADTLVRRVLLEQGQAVGVEAADGRVFKASREVILSAGAMESPKILMLSGIGPPDQLSKFGIPITHANPNVGQNFQDHVAVMVAWQENEDFTQRPAFFRNRDAQKAALREWELRRTGPFASLGQFALSFHEINEARHTAEFAALSEDERDFLTQPDVPFYEFVWSFSPYPLMPDPDDITATFPIFISLQFPQSRGSFALQSADANVPLAFDNGYLSHPFDKRQAIEATHKILSLMRSPELAKRIVGPLNVPASESDDDILAFWRENGQSCYHGSSTCKMGVRETEDQAVVDPDFKVFGVKGLRVADNSILPRVGAAHIQAHAYQTGMVAAAKIISEYGLTSEKGLNGRA